MANANRALIWIDKSNRAHIISNGVELGVADNFQIVKGAGGAVGRAVDEESLRKIPPKLQPYVRAEKDWVKSGIDARVGAQTIRQGAVVLAKEK